MRSGCGTNKTRGPALSRRYAILIAMVCGTNLAASAQSILFRRETEPRHSAPSKLPYESKGPRSPSLITPPKSPTLEAPYQSFTRQQSLRWFATNTMDPSNLVGGIFQSAFGTAANRPKEYGPHWGGFADRYGMGMTGSVTGNGIEAGVGLILREDPRYFRVPDRPFKARVGNVIRLAVAARGGGGRFGPAYARTMGILGNNLVSNSWRVHSEANTHDTLLRISEGFGGHLAGNAFEEFWPDVKKRILHVHKENAGVIAFGEKASAPSQKAPSQIEQIAARTEGKAE